MNDQNGNRLDKNTPGDLLFELVDKIPAAELDQFYFGMAGGDDANAAVYRIAERKARQLRMDGQPLPALLHDALKSTAAASVGDLLWKMGGSDRAIARRAARDIMGLPHVDNELAGWGLAGLLRQSCQQDYLHALVASGREQHPAFAEVCAFCDFRDPVSADDAIAWIADPASSLYVLAENTRFRYFLARVDPRGKRFSAAWLRLNPRDEVVLVHHKTEGKRLVDHVFHEFTHMAACLLGNHGEEVTRREDCK